MIEITAPKNGEKDRLRLMRLLAIGLMLGLGAGLYLGFNKPLGGGARHGELLFAPVFGAHGLVTNEYAYYNPFAPNAARSPDWELTSGSLFALRGTGWTGNPDGKAPGPRSLAATDSAVFRLVTRKAFRDVSVVFDWRLNGLVTTARTPGQPWDGLHLWVRYHSARDLYFVSFFRRDHQVVIGKKAPGGPVQGGHYESLAVYRGKVPRLRRWNHAEVTVENTQGGSVTIRLLLNGVLISRAVDRDAPPGLREPGRIGFRGDNANFEFRDFRVHSL